MWYIVLALVSIFCFWFHMAKFPIFIHKFLVFRFLVDEIFLLIFWMCEHFAMCFFWKWFSRSISYIDNSLDWSIASFSQNLFIFWSIFIEDIELTTSIFILFDWEIGPVIAHRNSVLWFRRLFFVLFRLVKRGICVQLIVAFFFVYEDLLIWQRLR